MPRRGGAPARACAAVGGRDSANLLDAEAQALPQSALGKAVAYTLNMWTKLERCLEYEEVELSNNLAENSMRPVAAGPQELAACWKREGRPEGSGHSLDRGIVPPARSCP